ncbi:MAG TPA: MBL fold metallo-hydrolase [Steroidobacteraceae bacterium]|nr:MBL fold metallo-hydrolase [Steroidobacteraceae bacterium]
MQLTFLGATQTVTGSRYLLRCETGWMLVDCGLFQGYKHLRLKNWARPLFDLSTLNAVVLTHAHLDHSGYLPLLVKQGFRGPIYATPPTIDLCRILLPDSGHLQEEQAEFANRHGFSKHSPALPLYTERDATECLKHFEPIWFEEVFEPVPDIRVHYSRAGHLLGAGSIRIESASTSVLFSGDLGRPADPLMSAPEPPPSADYVVVESTYGDRKHPALDSQNELRDVIRRTCERRGIVVIPTFAVGRAQLLLLLIARLKAARAIPDIPVYLDSPMAIDATELLTRHAAEHRFSPSDAASIGRTARLVRTAEESKSLDRIREPAIILAASGMATGGRVVHHLKMFVTDARNTILFSGFQAGGTRGASLVAGARELRIHGETFPVRAEVCQLQSASAHADADEVIAWLRQLQTAPRQVFVTHGESSASDALRQRIQSELNWTASVPEYRDEVELAKD